MQLVFKVVEAFFEVGNEYLKFKYRKQQVVCNILFSFQLCGCNDNGTSEIHASLLCQYLQKNYAYKLLELLLFKRMKYPIMQSICRSHIF